MFACLFVVICVYIYIYIYVCVITLSKFLKLGFDMPSAHKSTHKRLYFNTRTQLIPFLLLGLHPLSRLPTAHNCLYFRCCFLLISNSTQNLALASRPSTSLHALNEPSGFVFSLRFRKSQVAPFHNSTTYLRLI